MPTTVNLGRVRGRGISSIDQYYALSRSNEFVTSSWSKETPAPVMTSTEKYLWNYEVVNYDDGTSEGSSSDAKIIGAYGDSGDGADLEWQSIG